jgi:CDP-diacylglycerol--glycerol-3-phosphate 3-phosphatidyltransferase
MRVGEWLSDYLSPNLVTGSRFVLSVPVGVFLRLLPSLGAVLYLLAELTDLLDGWLARKKGRVTKVGEWFDILADHSLALVFLSSIGSPFLWQPIWIFALVSEAALVLYVAGLMMLTQKEREPAPMKYRFKWTGKFLLNLLLLGSLVWDLDFRIFLNALSILVSSRNLLLLFELSQKNT